MRPAFIILFLLLPTLAPARDWPNVLLIAIDDLNDWVGCLGGHPQANTPNIDRLARQGVLFENAHCQAPVCQSSRASLMSSLYPHQTGLYFLNPDMDAVPTFENRMTLPERFAAEGYRVMAAGKLFHNQDNARIFGKIGEYGGNMGSFGPRPDEKISQPFGHALWDWGAFPESEEDMPDMKIAHWAESKLVQDYQKPFFMAIGFFRPHVPMYAPQAWFDKFPRESILLPQTLDTDRDDLPQYAKDLTTLKHVTPPHSWMVESGEWSHAVQAYLASSAFADHCLGLVLNALEASRYSDNTIVVLFGDHGFHLGEKQRWAKRTLWEDGTRVPLIVADPRRKAGSVSNRPAGLIDIYPTLVELCQLEEDAQLQGRSLAPLLEDPAAAWDRPIMTTYGPGNHSFRGDRYRYIRYNDGSEELYDHASDPAEWRNLAGNALLEPIKKHFAAMMPTDEMAIQGEGSTGHLAYEATEANRSK